MTGTVTQTGPAALSWPVAPAVDLAGVFERALGDARVPGRHGLLVAPRAALVAGDVVDLGRGPVDRAAVVDKATLTELPHPVLDRCGLVVARFPGTAGDDEGALVLAVRTALVTEAQRVLAQGVRQCQEFLAGRRSGDRPLSAHPVVAHATGAAVAAVATVRHADMAAALGTPAGRAWLVAAVDDAAAALVGLAGGRALLAGHLVGLRTVLLTVNRVYLGGDRCTR